MGTSPSWVVYAVGSAVFAACTAVFGKIGVTQISSNLATFLRTIVILAVSAGIITLRREWAVPSELPPRSILALFLSGVATGLSWLCYYRALQTGPVGSVAAVDKISVLIVVGLAILFFGEPLTWKVTVGAVLIVIGVVLISR